MEISKTAARRVKIGLISTPWGRKRVHVQLWYISSNSRCYAQMWKFWKLARTSNKAACRAKISSISISWVERRSICNVWNFFKFQISCPNMAILIMTLCLRNVPKLLVSEYIRCLSDAFTCVADCTWTSALTSPSTCSFAKHLCRWMANFCYCFISMFQSFYSTCCR